MTSPTWFTDFQEIIQTIIAGLFGAFTAYIIEWYRKRKTPKEQEATALKTITDASNENVVTSQKLVEMLDIRLEKEKAYYEGLIERSKKECQEKINSMKELYDGMMLDLQSQVLKGTEENLNMSREIRVLTSEKNELQRKVGELQMRLGKYESESTSKRE